MYMETKISYSFLVLLVVLAIIVSACSSQSQTSHPENISDQKINTFVSGKLNPAAPPETEQLGQLVGVWEAEQVKRNRDGSWSEEKTRAEWRWYYILDGHAIQDDWISLQAADDTSQVYQPIGTNIRIYNSEENQWHMAWIDKTNRRLATFTAVNEDGKIIMSGQNAQGRQIRNTFFDITQNEFDWQQEWTFDEGKTWVAVAKIHCERKL